MLSKNSQNILPQNLILATVKLYQLINDKLMCNSHSSTVKAGHAVVTQLVSLQHTQMVTMEI